MPTVGATRQGVIMTTTGKPVDRAATVWGEGLPYPEWMRQLLPADRSGEMRDAPLGHTVVAAGIGVWWLKGRGRSHDKA